MARPRREKSALVQLKTRMRETLRVRLEEAAKARGVSINAEIVDRLERSFDRQDLLPEVLTLAYGQQLAGILIMLGTVMNWIGPYCHLVETGRMTRITSESAGHWTSDPDAFDQAAQAAATLLDAIRPGDPVAYRPPVTAAAEQMIRAVRGDADESSFAVPAGTIRSLLGPLAEKLKEAQPRVNSPRPNRLIAPLERLTNRQAKPPIRQGKQKKAPPPEVIAASIESFAEEIITILMGTYEPSSPDALAELVEDLMKRLAQRLPRENSRKEA